jgi:multiple sugar transport system permease protein
LFFTTRLYQAGWLKFQMGYASALAWVLLLVTMVCTLVIMKTSSRWVFYQGGDVKA